MVMDMVVPKTSVPLLEANHRLESIYIISQVSNNISDKQSILRNNMYKFSNALLLR
jgi:hypothetical protein